jgi:cytochrome c peroxidase
MVVLVGCRGEATGPTLADQQLRDALRMFGVAPLGARPVASPELLRLGQALMFDKELSGNRDISCGTCHSPSSATSEPLSISVGTGGIGQGAGRHPGPGRGFVPRHTPELFNRGAPEFTTMFWDGSIHREPDGSLVSTVGALLPTGLSGPLAAQALFPVGSPLEMKGLPGDVDVRGAPNELAMVPNSDFIGLWQAIMDRLLAIPEYVTLFREAFPALGNTAPGIAHAANAIAAFEAATWHSAGSPFDRYLAGDDHALDTPAKRGAQLFFGVIGDAGCVQCHSGPHLTDMEFANIGIPAIGPGKNPEAPLDFGRERITANATDRFAFRTPPLRNVELTGPWMHNGAYTTLDAAVRHYVNVPQSLVDYDASQLTPALAATHQSSAVVTDAIRATLDPRVAQPLALTEADVRDLVAFLRALTDPAARNLEADIPQSVPSGLPVN